MSKLSEKSPETFTSAIRTSTAKPAEFSPDQRRILLAIAHEAIQAPLEGRQVPDTAPAAPEFAEPRGVFTTLYLSAGTARHQLRGCVGYAMPVAPLHRAVAETARAAAFDDSRFSPVTMEEYPRLDISLSILSRLEPIGAEAVEIGRHGLLISQGNRRGLLLPQVPIEQGWDRETFLEQTCRKAGLPTDAWRHNTTIEAFTAEVFGDIEEPSDF
jgi:AmmeMemoRadiSam system protein A